MSGGQKFRGVMIGISMGFAGACLMIGDVSHAGSFFILVGTMLVFVVLSQ